jgi:hypothetical protein
MTYIKSLSEYIDEISELNAKFETGQLLYRGHSNRSFKAEPSVLRTRDFQLREHEMLRQLFAEHPDDFSRDTSRFEHLARAQHYGLPTRLLDVSRNPLVALYFACHEADGTKGANKGIAKRRAAGEVVVFLPGGMRKSFFDSDAVSYLCCLAYMTFDEKKVLKDHLLQCREDAQRETYEQTEEDFRQLFFEKFNKGACVQDLVRLVSAENRGVKDSIHPEDLMNIVSVVPRKLDVRISSQSGEFLIFGLFNPEREISESTTRDPEPTRHFLQGFERYEIYISPKDKASIIRDLNALGISHETLFPSLEGTAKRIKEGRV